MFLSIIALLAQASQSPNTPARLIQTIEGAHTLSAVLTLSSPKTKETGTIRLEFVRPSKLYYSLKWGSLDFTFVGNESGFWDSEAGSRTYEDSPSWQFSYPFSVFSGIPELFTPGYLMDGTMLSEGIARLADAGPSTVDGIKVEKLVDAAKHRLGELYVRPDGQPVRSVSYRSGGDSLTREPASIITADVKSLVIDKPIPDSVFELGPPVGYKAFSLPLSPDPIHVGKKFPLTGWNRNLAAQVAKSDTLVMITEPGCEPSALAASSLKAIESSVKVSIALISLSPAGGVPAADAEFARYYDPSGRLTRQVNAPGTPFFYLLDTSGTILKSWYGFDPSNQDEFVKDVVGSAK